MTAPVNITGNVSGIGSQGPSDPLKINDSEAKKYKKRNKKSFIQFISRLPIK